MSVWALSRCFRNLPCITFFPFVLDHILNIYFVLVRSCMPASLRHFSAAFSIEWRALKLWSLRSIVIWGSFLLVIYWYSPAIVALYLFPDSWMIFFLPDMGNISGFLRKCDFDFSLCSCQWPVWPRVSCINSWERPSQWNKLVVQLCTCLRFYEGYKSCTGKHFCCYLHPTCISNSNLFNSSSVASQEGFLQYTEVLVNV